MLDLCVCRCSQWVCLWSCNRNFTGWLFQAAITARVCACARVCVFCSNIHTLLWRISVCVCVCVCVRLQTECPDTEMCAHNWLISGYYRSLDSWHNSTCSLQLKLNCVCARSAAASSNQVTASDKLINGSKSDIQIIQKYSVSCVSVWSVCLFVFFSSTQPVYITTCSINCRSCFEKLSINSKVNIIIYL